MSYTPMVPPQEAERLPTYLDDEFQRVSQEIGRLASGLHDILYKPPVRFIKGMVIYADGTSWNPGSGEGLYRYSLGGTWVYIG